MKRLEVDWDRVAEKLQTAAPPTLDDASRAMDGTPLDSGAAIVRHMAQLETSGEIPHMGTMFRELVQVLNRDGEDRMLEEMYRLYGHPAA